MRHSIRILLCVLALLTGCATPKLAGDPTSGWTPQALHYSIQYPYDLKPADRYSYDAATDTHHFWVFSNDLPHMKISRTLPRTEMRVDSEYTSGQHQFEADMMVPDGTSNVSLMQVFGGSLRGHSTSLQLRVYAGNLKSYDDTIVATNIYGRWLHLNVTHDVSTHAIQIFVDRRLALTTEDNGGKSWYFKCGVYGQEGMSHKMEAYFRDIKIYTR
jgi:hypothetical protein